MRAIRGSVPRLAALALLAAALAGCGSVRPAPTQRMGLLDRLDRADRQLASRHKLHHPKPLEDQDRRPGPAAVEIDPKAKELGFRWPLDSVTVTSRFGQRGKEFHEGIDLRAESGTPVYAAQSGVVLYADKRIRGYGKMVVIRHQFGQVATIYAHNSRLLVHAGQKVRRGQRIAISGSTGHVTGPHLHFEIREGQDAVNPLKLLPRVPGVAYRDPVPGSSEVVLSSR